MRIAVVLAAGSLLLSSASFAKEIPPGALHVCGADHCRAVNKPADARAFSALLWGEEPVLRAPTPRVGSPVFALRYASGPAGAIVSRTAIRVHGLDCGRFQRDPRTGAAPAERVRSALLLATAVVGTLSPAMLRLG